MVSIVCTLMDSIGVVIIFFYEIYLLLMCYFSSLLLINFFVLNFFTNLFIIKNYLWYVNMIKKNSLEMNIHQYEPQDIRLNFFLYFYFLYYYVFGVVCRSSSS